ncbi:unnamed protein product [Leuciscus chuanchicus]
MEVEKDEDRQGQEEGIKERRRRNKQNNSDSINKRPLPYCVAAALSSGATLKPTQMTARDDQMLTDESKLSGMGYSPATLSDDSDLVFKMYTETEQICLYTDDTNTNTSWSFKKPHMAH